MRNSKKSNKNDLLVGGCGAVPQKAERKVSIDGMELEMAWVEPGRFLMGSPEEEEGRSVDERQHLVKLTKGYWMGKYPVTQAEWETVMGSNPSHFRGARLPVGGVSWEECHHFCEKLNQKLGKEGRVRLPTEAEWEYAARGGVRKQRVPYSGGGRLEKVGWYGDNSRSQMHAVGLKKANALGIHDLCGNAWEWCEDWYGEYPEQPTTDPHGPETGEYRVLRGGSWFPCEKYCRAAYRYRVRPDQCGFSIGFRLVWEPGQQAG